MLKTFEYRLYPNKEQEWQIMQHIGCSRWVYNYGLEKKIRAWTVDKKNLSKFDIQKDLPKLKKQEETNWLSDVIAQSLQASLENLDRAYKNFFRNKNGFPKFKSKHSSKQSFEIPQYSSVDFENNKLKVLKISPINIVLHRKFEGKIKKITIKKSRTNKYFACILVETPDEIKKKNDIIEGTTIGIDLGIKNFITLSNGIKIENPKTLNKYEKKLKKLQRKLSKKKLGGKNREKAKVMVALVHEKIRNVRKDFLNKLSHKLTNESQVSTIVIEDLNVSGMVRNHCLAKSISDCGWGEFVRQLEYKSDWYGKNLIKIGRFEPSSMLCSNCGTINHNLKLADREWTCNDCGTMHDRDINAAINIKNFGLSPKVPKEFRELTLGESRC